MSAEHEIVTDDDGRIHIKPAETGNIDDIWIAGQPIGKMINRLNERVTDLETELRDERERNGELRREVAEYKKMLADLHQKPEKEEYGSKKELAEKIAHDEAVRVSTKGISGGAIEYGDVRDIADRQYSRELNSGTIYTAFDNLAEEYAYFSVKEGEKGPNTANKQLLCDREDVPKPVLQRVNQSR